MKSEEIDDIYELSPMQAGMLFHSLAAERSGVYVLQFVCPLTGGLDETAFERAWEGLAARHAVLRTSFHWQELDKPLQVVHQKVALPLARLDWRSIPEEAQEQRLRSLLREDRVQGFDLSQVPLVRLLLIRTGDTAYRLLWTTHHILLDGWCLGLVLQELLELYDGFRRGEPVRLPPVRPYADYIEWLQSQDAAAAEAFWRRILSGFGAATRLGVDRLAAPAASDGAALDPGGEAVFAEESLVVPSDLTGELQSFAARHHLTLSTLVQGAWARLLGQYSGEEDVLFGSVISGRPPDFPGVESMVGLFVNTLPVRTRLRPEPAVSSWLREFQMLQLELHRYGHSSLLDVQGWSEVPRSRPLFESLVAFENYPRRAHTAGRQEGTAALEMGGISSFEQTNYPLTLFAVPGAGIALRASYDPQRFEAMAVRRMLVHLRSFLEALNEVAEAPLAGWSCIGAAERQEILGWSAGPPTAAPASSIGRLLSNQAARTPDAVAVTGDGAQVSYQELNRRARRLARRLRSLGVGPEQRVAICTKRSLDLVTGILGVLEAGGAYVPLDPAYPRERLSFMLEDSGAAVLLTRHELLGSLPPTTARVVCLDEEHLALPSQDTLPSWGEAEPDHLAYVIYTSGSTGRPKGVAIEHRSVLALLDWARSSFAPEELAGVVAATSVCFDLSVFELLVPLSLGGRVILVENALHVASDEAATGATLLNSVPSAVTGLLRGGLPPGVQTVNLAGEPLKRSLVDELYRQAGVRRVLNLYGPSEDTTYSTIATLEPGSADAPDIGRPVSGTRIYLLDGSLFPVPTGLAGELCIAGAGLARGYLGRPELTAERFVPDPFGSTGERLYRTGDRARYLLDGRLDFLGRVDLQVKVRGFRIELGEIEAILASHPGVLEAVVVAHHDAAGEKRLVAFLRLSAEQEPTGTELRDLLRGHLPEPMVPSTFVALDDMPLLPNGKVDRRALAARDLEPAALPSSFAAPRNELERQIAAIWCEVLGLPQVSVQDSFFDIGGHSLLVLQVQKRLQETLETPLAITDLFRFPTIALLAEKLSDQGSADSSAPATGRERAEARRASMQRRQSALAVEEDDAQSST